MVTERKPAKEEGIIKAMRKKNQMFKETNATEIHISHPADGLANRNSLMKTT
jgi:hypothetical protein